jgi:hypothetical protein
MSAEPSPIDSASLGAILEIVKVPFWYRLDFWISSILGIGGLGVSVFGLVFSIKAFREAKKAAHAAKEAGRSVKIQTTTVELTEVAQKLDRISPEIQFNEARDLVNEISRRLRRAVAPFARDEELKESIEAVYSVLGLAKAALSSVRPADKSKESQVPEAVYYGVEGQFGAISDAVAGLIGLFEKKGFKFGDVDGES